MPAGRQLQRLRAAGPGCGRARPPAPPAARAGRPSRGAVELLGQLADGLVATARGPRRGWLRTAATGSSPSTRGRGSRAASARGDAGSGRPRVAARRSRRLQHARQRGYRRRPRRAERDPRVEPADGLRDSADGPLQRRARHHPHRWWTSCSAGVIGIAQACEEASPGGHGPSALRGRALAARRAPAGGAGREAAGLSGLRSRAITAAENGGDGPLRGRRSTATPGGGSRHRSQTRWREPGWYRKSYRIQPSVQPLAALSACSPPSRRAA